MRRDRIGSRNYVAQVGFAILIQGRWDADDDRVHFLDVREIRSSREAALAGSRNIGWRNAMDVRAMGIQRLHLLVVDVESGDCELFFRKEQRQWESHISQANDPDV